MIDWFFTALKTYPEIAIFLALAIGYYFGKFTFKGIGLGSVTATLIAAVVIGQIGITVNQPLKAFSFLMFLFAVGYGVGPQFVRGIASSGLPQAIFSVVQCVFSLAVRGRVGLAGRCAPTKYSRVARPPVCASLRLSRWCPMRGSSSCAFVAGARSWMRPRISS